MAEAGAGAGYRNRRWFHLMFHLMGEGEADYPRYFRHFFRLTAEGAELAVSFLFHLTAVIVES